eukprot:Gregarina_sp_Poly_1__8129@NODE_46_length_17826_cov_295_961822_g40_i0_p1_GENE_NODE_46_length_17826_cov_295_961822_g40_i0NODE_46_length_17826_cov_295_961822_g40_i0_p1_ORF_typecomplete_len2435_score345_41zfUBR/PF02207_20/3_9e14zfUBR/PF02207_20/1_5e04zfUBR/PF02207_20/4_9e03zfUBR/PF02207_20/2_5e03FANCL_C/PF11793_8/1_8e04FANCL_C/PF11793_8/0_01XPCbinding/PF09280_11/3_7XPCbinding/PF09280_11/4e03XPCbinding/PF09280_11/53_NODE_46_length_17826_cov_295_961822_g40_i01052117777
MFDESTGPNSREQVELFPFPKTPQKTASNFNDAIWKYLFQCEDYEEALTNVANNSKGGACPEQWDKESIAFKCHDCESDNSCALCVECFFKSNHVGHTSQMIRTVGGCCDCGDISSWAPEGCCPDHRGLTATHFIECAQKQLEELDRSHPGFSRRSSFAFRALATGFWEAVQALVERRAAVLSEEVHALFPTCELDRDGNANVIRAVSLWVLATALAGFVFRHLVEEYFFSEEQLTAAVKTHSKLPSVTQKTLQHVYLSLVGFPVFKRRFGLIMGSLFVYTLSNEGLGGMCVQVFTVAEVACELVENGNLERLLDIVIAEIPKAIHLVTTASPSLRYMLRAIPPEKMLGYLPVQLSALAEYFHRFYELNKQQRAVDEHVPYENKVSTELFVITVNLHKGLMKFYDWLKVPLAHKRYSALNASEVTEDSVTEEWTHPTQTSSNKVLGILHFQAILRVSKLFIETIQRKGEFSLENGIMSDRDQDDWVSFHYDTTRFLAQIQHYEAIMESFSGALCFTSEPVDLREVEQINIVQSVFVSRDILSVFSVEAVWESAFPLLRLLCRSSEIKSNFWVRNGTIIVGHNQQYCKSEFGLRTDVLWIIFCMMALKMHELGCSTPGGKPYWWNSNCAPLRLLMMSFFTPCCSHGVHVSPETKHKIPHCGGGLVQWHDSLCRIAFDTEEGLFQLHAAAEHKETSAPITKLLNFWTVVGSLVAVGVRQLELTSSSKEHLLSQEKRKPTTRPTISASSLYARRTEGLAKLDLIRTLALSNRCTFSAVENKLPKIWRSHPSVESLLRDISDKNDSRTSAGETATNGATDRRTRHESATFALKAEMWKWADLYTLDLTYQDVNEAEERALREPSASLIGPSWKDCLNLLPPEYLEKVLMFCRLISGDGVLYQLIFNVLKWASSDPLQQLAVSSPKQPSPAIARSPGHSASSQWSRHVLDDMTFFRHLVRDRMLICALKTLCDCVLPLWHQGPFTHPEQAPHSLWEFCTARIHSLMCDSDCGIVPLLELLINLKAKFPSTDSPTHRVLNVALERVREAAAENAASLQAVAHSCPLPAGVSMASTHPSGKELQDRVKAQQASILAAYQQKQQAFLDLMNDDEHDDLTSDEDSDSHSIESSFDAKVNEVLQPRSPGRLDALLSPALSKKGTTPPIASVMELSDLTHLQCAICYEGPTPSNFLFLIAYASYTGLYRRFWESPLPGVSDGGPCVTSCGHGGAALEAVPVKTPAYSVCGHMAHLSCLTSHCREIARERSRRQHYPMLRVEAGEFLCPFCRALSNSALPYFSLSSLFSWSPPQVSGGFPSADNSMLPAAALRALCGALKWNTDDSVSPSENRSLPFDITRIPRIVNDVVWCPQESGFRCQCPSSNSDSSTMPLNVGFNGNLVAATGTNRDVAFLIRREDLNTLRIAGRRLTLRLHVHRFNIQPDGPTGTTPMVVANGDELMEGLLPGEDATIGMEGFNVLLANELTQAMQGAIQAGMITPLRQQGDTVLTRVAGQRAGATTEVTEGNAATQTDPGDATEIDGPLARDEAGEHEPESSDTAPATREASGVNQHEEQRESGDTDTRLEPPTSEGQTDDNRASPESAAFNLGREENRERSVEDSDEHTAVVRRRHNPIPEFNDSEDEPNGDADDENYPETEHNIMDALMDDVRHIEEDLNGSLEDGMDPTTDTSDDQATSESVVAAAELEIECPTAVPRIVLTMLQGHLQKWGLIFNSHFDSYRDWTLPLMRARELPFFASTFVEILRVARHQPQALLSMQSLDSPKPLFVALIRLLILATDPSTFKTKLIEDPNAVWEPSLWKAGESASLDTPPYIQSENGQTSLQAASPWVTDAKKIFLREFVDCVSASRGGDVGILRSKIKSLAIHMMVLSAVQVVNTCLLYKCRHIIERSRHSYFPYLHKQVQARRSLYRLFGLEDAHIYSNHLNSSIRYAACRLDWFRWREVWNHKADTLVDTPPMAATHKQNEEDELESELASAFVEAFECYAQLSKAGSKICSVARLDPADAARRVRMGPETFEKGEIMKSVALKDLGRYHRSPGIDRFRRLVKLAEGALGACPGIRTRFDLHLQQNWAACMFPQALPKVPFLFELTKEEKLVECGTLDQYTRFLWQELLQIDETDTGYFERVIAPLVASAIVDFLKFAILTISGVWKFDQVEANRMAYPAGCPFAQAEQLRSVLEIAPEILQALIKPGAQSQTTVTSAIRLLWCVEIRELTLEKRYNRSRVNETASHFLTAPEAEENMLCPIGMPFTRVRFGTRDNFGFGRMLPEKFYDLVAQQAKRKCPECDWIPTEHAICLDCGAVSCLREIGQGRDGETTSHAAMCGQGDGVFMLPYICFLLFVSGNRSNVAACPYLDQHGEPDTYLDRGKETWLHTEKLLEAAEIWQDFLIPREILRITERSGRYLRRSL